MEHEEFESANWLKKQYQGKCAKVDSPLFAHGKNKGAFSSLVLI